MRGYISQYTNEIIGLTVMLLMCMALISGEAGANASQPPLADDAHIVAIDIEFSIRQKGELE